MRSQKSATASRGEPRVVIGMPLFEPGAMLADALEGLLSQTYDEYRVVLLDDASSDPETLAVIEHATLDPRVAVRRNPVRLGLAANWTETFRVARELHPGAELFAWAGHHDRWEEDWLAAMVALLDANPRAVLAYPLDARMRIDGTPTDDGTPPFSTAGTRDPRGRVSACARDACAGSAIYGVTRTAALERAGVFEVAVRPDRLALAKLAMLGEFVQEPRVLWRRRTTNPPTVRRQRAAIFPTRVPMSARVPWPLIHAASLARWLVRSRPQPIARGQVPLVVAAYLGPTLVRDLSQIILDQLLRLEGRLPHGSTARVRQRLGRAPRRLR